MWRKTSVRIDDALEEGHTHPLVNIDAAPINRAYDVMFAHSLI